MIAAGTSSDAGSSSTAGDRSPFVNTTTANSAAELNLVDATAMDDAESVTSGFFESKVKSFKHGSRHLL